MISLQTRPTESSPHDSRPKILAVDDRAENLVAISAAFDGCGYHIVEASSGAEAVRLAATFDFAAILLDVQMPEMDGFEAALRIRAQESSRNTPIIFVTAIDRKDMIEYKGYISGAVDFLYKPLDSMILLAKVGVFVDLYRAKQELRRQADLLREQALKEQEFRLLQRGIKVRDEFLSIASHELNTPLTPLSLQMQAFIRILREGKLGEVEPERLARMLEISFGQVERLSRIVAELLDVSRITTGKFRLKRKTTSLAKVVRSVVEEFQAEIQELGCEVKLTFRAEPMGVWDEIRIQQVVVNLISNALKYGLGHPIEVTVEEFESYCRLTVKDHGIGIAAEDHIRIFERFERAVSNMNYGGLGLGLYITKEIVKLHEGLIAVESQLGQGALFRVDLPRLK